MANDGGRTVAAHDLPKGMLKFRHARQAFRVRRQRTVAKTGEAAEETAYGIRSVAAERAERLLAWNRGHWMVENGNHHPRDASLGEDACRVRVRHAPANNAIMNNIALTVPDGGAKTAQTTTKSRTGNRPAAHRIAHPSGSTSRFQTSPRSRQA